MEEARAEYHRESLGATALTEREKDVLRLLCRGISPVEIAGELNISPVTVRHHIQHMYEKLGVHSKSDAIMWALRSGFAE